MSSVSTRQPTSIEVFAVELTWAWSTTISPTWTRDMKSSRSIDAVTTPPWAWRIAATPAHTSIHCIMTPPNMTPATPLVCIGITICVITQRVCSGVTPELYFFLDGAAGFLAALAVSMRRLIRRLSLVWRFLRRIFQVRRLSPRPIRLAFIA